MSSTKTEVKTVDKYGFLSASQRKTENLHKENARIEKWAKMLGDWDRYTLSKSKKLKNRIRKGIPSCFRGRIWYLLSDADVIKENYPANYYASLLSLEAQRNVEIEITLDLDRTFPNHVLFRGIEGKQSLYRVLRAYAIMDPEVSYTQGMSFIVAMFLIFLSEEETFWLLVTLLTQYDFRSFFIHGMPKIYGCFYVANGVLRHYYPGIYKNFRNSGLSISMYATQWFMTGFTSNFTIEASLRIWDCFFNEGAKIFYRVFLSVLSTRGKDLSHSCFEKSMEILRVIGVEIDTERLMKQAFKFSLSRKLLTRLEYDYSAHPKEKYVDWVLTKQ